MKYPASYGHLVQKYLNISLGKHATLSNWARRPLSKEQIKYAAEDVLHLLPLWDSITKELHQRGRFKYAQHYCDAQRTRVLHVPEPSELLHQHPALIHLAPQQACVLQELLFWRYGLAKDNNQPVRSVLSDGHVVELAKRQPSSISSMREDRRMPKKVVSNYGPELIERISRAGSRPEWAWPKYIRKDTPEWVQKHRLLSFVLHDGLANQYGQRLVLPSNHLDAIILEKPDTLAALQDHISSTAFDLAGTRLWAFLSGANGLFF